MKKHAAGVKKLMMVPLLILTITIPAKPLLAAESFYTIDNVNLRKDATTDSQKLTLVKTGTEVAVEEYNPEGWSKVTYSGLNGYMKSCYIGKKEDLKNAVEQNSNLPVEYTPWSEAKQIFTVGVTAKVTDVLTGLTYNVKSFSNGLHADVEPVTKEDTATLKRTYGGKWNWDPRPVWVTINGHTMAASINGMPHGGGVNSNSGMDGQVCIHFKGSTTHNGNNSFAQLHQKEAERAYNLSKSR